MKPTKPFSLLCMLVLLIITGCKKEEDGLEPILNNDYTGMMTYEYTKGFPPFTAIASLNVEMNKDGILTSGEFVTALFQKEAIHYDGGKPAFKYRVGGTVTFDAADGLYEEINGEDKILIKINSVVDMIQEVYGYDEDQGFILVEVDTMKYEDRYEDGNWEFSLDDAVINGSKIIVSYPDIEGTARYGYSLYLTPVIK